MKSGLLIILILVVLVVIIVSMGMPHGNGSGNATMVGPEAPIIPPHHAWKDFDVFLVNKSDGVKEYMVTLNELIVGHGTVNPGEKVSLGQNHGCDPDPNNRSGCIQRLIIKACGKEFIQEIYPLDKIMVVAGEGCNLHIRALHIL